MEIFKWLDDPDFVNNYTIIDFRDSAEAYYLNLEVQFMDTSLLYVREFVAIGRRKYAFHWQESDGNLIIRWDNAPHFPNLSTFPHHKHIADTTVEISHDISLEDVLKYIQSKLQGIKID